MVRTTKLRPLHILLINPNSTVATTDMMVAIARETAGGLAAVVGSTATRAPPIITTPEALAASADEVVEIALAHRDGYDGMIVAAFGDPGLSELRRRCEVPTVGLAEAAMLEASQGGRRFGIATTTANLVPHIDATAAQLGLAGQYTGTRITAGDFGALMSDPDRLRAALADAVAACIARDGADSVIIGGGPLGQAAQQLQQLFAAPITAPIPAAVRHLLRLLAPDQAPSPLGRGSG